ncbi:hypothetical protein AWB68_05701 [Caballeronia choica]|uniref:Uncharacterized protein n=1 Tax=Caballeronia choica TaxID=326476 RepID=A0A158KF42_9BURK|nr:hypothetical protein [Caballeronia choica]SAL79727.1 hypothetical protein AWB68_05701 [Caballeronia choica]
MSYIREWIESINREVADASLKAQAQREADEQAQREREARTRRAQDERRASVRLRIEQHRLELTRRRADTLDQQLARWWAAQPPDRRNRGHGFEEIRCALQGLSPGAHAANPALSAALRAAGWRRTRLRDTNGEAWAVWWPPSVTPDAPRSPGKAH